MLLEGTEPAARADCASPEIRILTSQPRPGLALPRRRRSAPRRAGARRPTLGTGEQRRADAAACRPGAGCSRCSTSPPSSLTLSAPGLQQPLPAALDGQRPNTISLANDGQFWPAGDDRQRRRRRSRFTISADGAEHAAEPHAATRARPASASWSRSAAEPHRIVPLERGLRTAGSTGTSRPKRPKEAALAAMRSGVDADHVPDEARLFSSCR